MISGSDVRKKYLDFFAVRGHVVIPSAPLVPENDPTTLFTGSGMQPMLQYLLGAPYPEGKTRIVDSQKCFRSQDIEEVGDNRHTTSFEMLGNWSLGDYFKKEQLTWMWEFFTQELGLDKNHIFVSVFEGDTEIPRDDEAVEIWKSLGVPEERIFYYSDKKNWWSRSGPKANMPVGEPGGPDSEIFYDFGEEHQFHENSQWKNEECHPNCDCGRFIEIGNNVFMTYVKTDSGFEPLKKKNIDYGGGLERIAAAVHGVPDIFVTSLYKKIIAEVEEMSGKSYADNTTAFRIIADHLKASVFLIADGVTPSNKSQGYFLRRLLRRSLVKLQQLGISTTDFTPIIKAIIDTYSDTDYFKNSQVTVISSEISSEAEKFAKTLKDGLKRIGDTTPFDLFQTYGFPPEVTEELLKQEGKSLDWDEFNKEKSQHQDLSRTAGKGMFKGGLQDQSEITTRYHTATHLLHASLRKILGDHVQQKGSNITADRLRFDFSHDSKLTNSQIHEIEDLVNQQIIKDLPVTKVEMRKTDALAQGALAFFPEKYPDVTNVYSIGDPSTGSGQVFSKELCGGPHVNSTGIIGKIKITREESAGAGIRRIYATALPQKEN